ncbi:MAG: hypothetical protein ABJA98_18755 [Acidobacteriota bacterium]
MKKFALCLLAATATVVALHAAELPVVASRLVTGPNSHVDLTNTSSQPVTAWTLVVTTTQPDGTVHRATETVDAYLSEVTKEFAGMSARVERLLPGQTREIALDPAGTGAIAEVTAVILQDGTALGDPEALASVFEHRAQERDQLHEVVNVFESVLPSSRGAAALEGLKRAFAIQAAQGESAAHQSAREAVDVYLQRATPATADAVDQLLRAYADIVRREYDLAEKHSHRKN